MPQGYLIFHLNLAFSSVPAAARADVIRKCYWPVLQLAEETGIPVGVEPTGWTLQQIASVDPAWMERFRQLLDDRRCELIGSGWSQIIGPLVPYAVNRWNQKLGLDAYRQLLGVTPKLALINEMAFSTGLVDVYAEAGYDGVLMDRDNVRLALGLDHSPLSATPTHALGLGERALPVLWSDSILFQRLQRVVHGDIPFSEYLAYVKQRADRDGAVLPIYCNDAEVFDHRPGRFAAESRLHSEKEWVRFKRVCTRVHEDLGLDWLSPSEALKIQTKTSTWNARRLTSVTQPIPVKKQAKYNINRWAVAGRDNVWLNTACHQILRALAAGNAAADDWRELCELWSSDLRTHITADRWSEALERVARVRGRLGLARQETRSETPPPPAELSLPKGVEVAQDEEAILWTVRTPYVRVVFNARRGLAIKSLGFKSHDYEPIIGSLPQGYFSTIELGADFYSGGVLIEIPGDRNRLTDLEWVQPTIRVQGSELLISATIPLAEGTLKKTLAIGLDTESVKLAYDFQQFERPLGIVRVGIVTLLPESFSLPLTVRCVNGGQASESFEVDQEVNHGLAPSTLVSSTAAFGATDGRIEIEDGARRKLVLSWNPAECAAIPLLKHRRSGERHLTRFSFSLSELDDTSRAGGRLPPFSLQLSPA